jgi:hypothetical protein
MAKSRVPAAQSLAGRVSKIGAEYLLPEALELCERLEHKKAADLTDDEIMMLAITAAQAALAKHVEPGDPSCDRTLNSILGILDHREVVQQPAINKLHRMLRSSSRPAALSQGCQLRRVYHNAPTLIGPQLRNSI